MPKNPKTGTAKHANANNMPTSPHYETGRWGKEEWRVYAHATPINQATPRTVGIQMDEDEAIACRNALNALSERRTGQLKTDAAIRELGRANGATSDKIELAVEAHRPTGVLGGIQLQRSTRLRLGIELAGARPIQVKKGDHTHAYWSPNTKTWWFVTDEALVDLGRALQEAQVNSEGTAYSGRDILDSWEERDSTGREITDQGERVWYGLPRRKAA